MTIHGHSLEGVSWMMLWLGGRVVKHGNHSLPENTRKLPPVGDQFTAENMKRHDTSPVRDPTRSALLGLTSGKCGTPSEVIPLRVERTVETWLGGLGVSGNTAAA